jgi:hypothetical protein
VNTLSAALNIHPLVLVLVLVLVSTLVLITTFNLFNITVILFLGNKVTLLFSFSFLY